MKFLNYPFLLLTLLWISCRFCVSYKILAVFQTPSYSHFIAGGAIAKELALKGHQVTVLSSYPQTNSIKNYKDIELVGLKEWMNDFASKLNLIDFENENIFVRTNLPYTIEYEMSKLIYENKQVKKLMKSKEKFDVVIIEQFIGEPLYGLCYIFKAPCISYSPIGSNSRTNRIVGNIGLASYVPDVAGYYSPKMTFFERLHNLYTLIFQELFYHLYALPKLDTLLHQYIPNSPPLSQLVYNTSLVLLNSHPALSGALLLTPNMIEIGGIHIQSFKDEKLPQDVQEFLDKHNEGVIYFAFGSSFKSKNIPKEILEEIFKTLRKYKKPILWKYEEELPKGLEHVKTLKWFPQTAVLAHKNIKAFITHCGRLSTLESLYYGVPMIGIPFFGDQTYNAAQMSYLGYALQLKFKTLTAEKLYKALIEITTNSTYYKEAQLRSKAMQRENQIEKSINWIEHVIEFKGASYLKHAGLNLSWYQFWMIDIALFLIILIVMNAFIGYVILQCCFKKSTYKSHIKYKIN